ncbi:hypothetical protein P7H20_16635 [Paenibacillus larvae]|nr:hypothetical protein [Paenibacillus larvae]MDT2276130.1 hypothetical protein [Paenibacillus larvae]
MLPIKANDELGKKLYDTSKQWMTKRRDLALNKGVMHVQAKLVDPHSIASIVNSNVGQLCRTIILVILKIIIIQRAFSPMLSYKLRTIRKLNVNKEEINGDSFRVGDEVSGTGQEFTNSRGESITFSRFAPFKLVSRFFDRCIPKS